MYSEITRALTTYASIAPKRALIKENIISNAPVNPDGLFEPQIQFVMNEITEIE